MKLCPKCRKEAYEEKSFSDGSKRRKCYECGYNEFIPPEPEVKEPDKNWFEQLPEEDKEQLVEDSIARNREELKEMVEEEKSLKDILPN